MPPLVLKQVLRNQGRLEEEGFKPW